jgi:hypothetical protein
MDRLRKALARLWRRARRDPVADGLLAAYHARLEKEAAIKERIKREVDRVLARTAIDG